MAGKEKYAIIMLIIAVVGLIPFSGLIDLAIVPNFEVVIKDSSNSTHQFELVWIRNEGFSQAKNALVHISSSDFIEPIGWNCVEGTFPKTQTKDFRINFDRLSQNVDCFVRFQSSLDGNIFEVTVTADDAAGNTYYPGKEETELAVQFALVATITLMVVSIVISINKSQKRVYGKIIESNEYPSVLKLELIKKYGQGFLRDDEEILRAIKSDKNGFDEIQVFTDIDGRDLNERLTFLEEKGVIYELYDSWYIDDSTIERKIPK